MKETCYRNERYCRFLHNVSPQKTTRTYLIMNMQKYVVMAATKYKEMKQDTKKPRKDQDTSMKELIFYATKFMQTNANKKCKYVNKQNKKENPFKRRS